MTDLKSHTSNEIWAAFDRGEEIWLLDTDCGEDDVLIGSREEVEHDIIHHHGELIGELVQLTHEGEIEDYVGSREM